MSKIFSRIIRRIRGKTGYDTSQFKKFGDGCSIGQPLSIKNPAYIEIGEKSYFLANARLDCWTSYEGEKLFPLFKVGQRCSFGFNFSAMCSSELTIDNDVMVGSYVLVTTLNHGINPENERSYQRQPLKSAPVHIFQGVWIGDKVTVLPGVNIGECSVIGANSVVTKDVPPYCIAAGNPARVIKKWDFEKHDWVKV